LLGAGQWRHPVVLSLAAVGGVWLVSFVIVAVNTAVAGAFTEAVTGVGGIRVRRSRRTRWALPAAVPPVVALTAFAAYALPAEPERARPFRVALVQPGVVHNPTVRFAAGERITAALPAVDLVVWGESSVGFDVDRRADLSARLTALAVRGDLLVNEDARDVRGRISKSSILIGAGGERGRYVKTRLVPFGEYIPFRSALGWLTRISRAAGQDRVPGTGVRVLTAAGVSFGPLVCFESAFPDLGRAVARHGAQVIVYQSATSTFQGSWAPAQHAALSAVRAAETGRPVVQAALTGVSTAYDARGRRLAWLDTARRGSVVVTLWVAPARGQTPFVRYGDVVPYLGLAVTAVALAMMLAGALPGDRQRTGRAARSADQGSIKGGAGSRLGAQ
jgi:apolipoprotein N-acyltransferase